MTVPFLQSRSIKLKVSPRFPANILNGIGTTVVKANGNYTINLDYSGFPVSNSLPTSATAYLLYWDSGTQKYTLLPTGLFTGGGGGGLTDAPVDNAYYGRQNATWQKVLALAGGALTGPLTLNADPTAPLGAATKNYVDASIAAGGTFVDAPVDGNLYGRLNGAWAKVFGTSRVFTGAGTVTVANDDRVVAINKATGAPTTVTLPLAANKLGSVLIADFKGDAGTNNITINATGPDTIMGLASWTIAGNRGGVTLFPISGVGYAI